MRNFSVYEHMLIVINMKWYGCNYLCTRNESTSFLVTLLITANWFGIFKNQSVLCFKAYCNGNPGRKIYLHKYSSGKSLVTIDNAKPKILCSRLHHQKSNMEVYTKLSRELSSRVPGIELRYFPKKQYLKWSVMT